MQVTTSEFSCTLPYGWHQIENPKALFTTIPPLHDGRFFGVAAEKAAACPIPRPIDEESDFEKGYWGRFESNFQKSAHCKITDRNFQMINGLPFRIIDAVRNSGAEKIFMEVASTPGNGRVYELLLAKKGALPESDSELQGLAESFTFLQPPRIAWYQPLTHEFSEIVGLPLLLVAAGLGIYFLGIQHRPDVPVKRKINFASFAAALAMTNAVWIAGLSSGVGIVSALLTGGFVLLLQPLVREARAQIARGEIAGPTPRKLKTRFWLLVGSCCLGVVLAEMQLLYSGLSFSIIIGSTLFTVAMFGFILWAQRRSFFPKSPENNDSHR